MKLNLNFLPTSDIPREWKDGRLLLAYERAGANYSEEPQGPWRVVWWREGYFQLGGEVRGEWLYAYSSGSPHDGIEEIARGCEPDYLAALPMEAGDVET